jgi:predicted secreted Zn-dependent protease
MARCKYCGTWSGLFDDEHVNCAVAAAQGKTVDEIRYSLDRPPAEAATPITNRSIFWAVFGALWAFGISAGIVAAILKAMPS